MRIAPLLLAALVSLPSMAGVIVLEGRYQGKNLFVQNPFSEAGVGFCVFEVTVNDQIATDEINSSAFEIDLGNYGLKLGEAIVVKVKHKDGCTPLILNPEVLKPKSTFDIVAQSISPEGTYKWTSTNETGELPYFVEQKRWNKWVKVGEVMGVGTPGEHGYEFKVTPHSGENTFRVKQVDLTKRSRYSEPVKYTDASVALVTWSPPKPKDEILFSANTLYEIYDQYGNIVKRGYANKIDITTLKKDLYYLNYDNKMGETFLKR
ncbi:MAG: hypothetical protein IPH53_06500 [Flavobacteriales bacterium]|nr:hypothetical protein [Flavobacteriales bacterium]MBK7084318.1 hypothetical protein [Flavobacteriales bacterium]MBK7268057.1 hypothetical protein [Flavobacteriales bacterium]